MKYHLVMEYLRGGDLLSRVNKIKSYSEKEAAAFMKVFAGTLAYLHEHGVSFLFQIFLSNFFAENL